MNYSHSAKKSWNRFMFPLWIALSLIFINSAKAQVFVAYYNVNYKSYISEYTATGQVLADPLISGFLSPGALAVSGTLLFVAEHDGNVCEYTTSGRVVSSNLISAGWANAIQLAVSGSNLFLAGTNGVAEYTTTGRIVNPCLIPISVMQGQEPGSFVPMAVSGNNIYLVRENGSNSHEDIVKYRIVSNEISEPTVIVKGSANFLNQTTAITVSGTNIYVAYNGMRIGWCTTDGSNSVLLINGNSSLICNPYALAVSGSNLFIANTGNLSGAKVSVYNTDGSKGKALISGSSFTFGLAATEGL